MATQERMIDKITALLTRAEHPNTPEAEREACFAKADQLMSANRIERAMLNFTTVKETVVVDRTIPAPDAGGFYNITGSILSAIATHASCFMTRTYTDYRTMYHIVGYEEDAFYAELLWTTVFRSFVRTINPNWEAALTFDANVKQMKDAGYKWTLIATYAGTDPVKSGGRLKSAYVRECKRLGVVPSRQTQRHSAYRDSFADAFGSTLTARLRAQKQTSDEEASGSGAELALVKDAARVKEEFYRLYPNLRPRVYTAEEMAERTAQQQADIKQAQDEWDALSDEEKIRYNKQTDRLWKAYNKRQAVRYDATGYASGVAAANGVDLTMGSGTLANETKELV